MAHGIEQSLCGDSWRMTAADGRSWKATVPGCAHLDLMREGDLPHPDSPGGEEAQSWVGRTRFSWSRRFKVDPEVAVHTHIDLVCERVDTVASVRVDGMTVLATANEFHPHRVDLRGVLPDDPEREHTIEIVCEGPVAEVERLERELGSRPVNGDWTPYPFMRKTACEFGWDFGPRVPSSGIRGIIALHGWSSARLVGVRPLVTQCTAERARVEVAVDAIVDPWSPSLDVKCEMVAPDGTRLRASGTIGTSGSTSTRVTFEIPRPMRWFPRGFGAQHLYKLDVAIVTGGETIDRTSCMIGLRSVELDSAADGIGERFVIKVNGEPIWCTGANWIPDGLFDQCSDRARLDARLNQACEANLVMLRVWGGGGYESDAFYSLCDERGILVWQDFAFACATYPEDDPFPARIEAEARWQVSRLSKHPSVAIWCGGNEDILAWAAWGFRERLREGQSWGRRYWLEILPRICAELDPTRPYWPESPWSGSLETHPNDPSCGDRHTWDQEAKVEGLRSVTPRFCSEFGHQSSPSLRSLAEALGIDERELGALSASEGCTLIASRQRATGGDHPQYRFLQERFPPATDFASWIVQAQVVQAKAMRIAFTWLRANRPRSMGALVWQLNDAWTGHAWSLIDVRGRAKPAWHAVRDACAPRIIVIQPRDGELVVDAINESRDPWRSQVLLTRLPLSSDSLGEEAPRHVERFEVAPRSVARVCVVPIALCPDDTAILFAEATTGLERPPLSSSWHSAVHENALRSGGRAFVPKAELRWAESPVTSKEGEVSAQLEVRATTPLMDAVIVPTGPWVSVEPMFLSMAGGESTLARISWRIEYTATLDRRAIGAELYCCGVRVAAVG